jgi:hypothetical protein
MPPRIRSLLPRMPFARETKAPAREAPQVFREFVETLQRLDTPAPPAKRAQRITARKRRYVGNGHKRPSSARSRSCTR